MLSTCALLHTTIPIQAAVCVSHLHCFYGSTLRFESEFHFYLIFVFSEEHAVLEGVLSGRSGGPEPCTGAGLPLEGDSWHTFVLPPKSREAPELLSAAGGWRCTLQPDSESVLLFVQDSGICSPMSTQANNFTLKPEELWGFQSEAAVYLWHINMKPKLLDQNKNKGPKLHN